MNSRFLPATEFLYKRLSLKFWGPKRQNPESKVEYSLSNHTKKRPKNEKKTNTKHTKYPLGVVSPPTSGGLQWSKLLPQKKKTRRFSCHVRLAMVLIDDSESRVPTSKERCAFGNSHNVVQELPQTLVIFGEVSMGSCWQVGKHISKHVVEENPKKKVNPPNLGKRVDMSNPPFTWFRLVKKKHTKKSWEWLFKAFQARPESY